MESLTDIEVRQAVMENHLWGISLQSTVHLIRNEPPSINLTSDTDAFLQNRRSHENDVLPVSYTSRCFE